MRNWKLMMGFSAVVLTAPIMSSCGTGPSKALIAIDSLVVVDICYKPSIPPYGNVVGHNTPIYLILRTTRTYPAATYFIQYSIHARPQGWYISLMGVYDSEFYWMNDMYSQYYDNKAWAEVPLGSPENGVYSFSLTMNDWTTLGLLFVEPECYRIEIPDTTYFRPSNSSLGRVPF